MDIGGAPGGSSTTDKPGAALRGAVPRRADRSHRGARRVSRRATLARLGVAVAGLAGCLGSPRGRVDRAGPTGERSSTPRTPEGTGTRQAIDTYPGAGCAACGSAIIAGLLGLVGAAGLLTLLPLEGLEFALLALVSVVLSTYWLAEGMRGGEINGCPVDLAG